MATSRKAEVGKEIRAAYTDLRAAIRRCERINTIFLASGYETGGVDPIKDSDLTAYRDLFTEDLNAGSTLIGTFGVFFTQGVLTQIDAFIDMGSG